MSSRSFASAVALLLLATRVVAAQPPAESGVARDARNGAPLRCLHVTLVDSTDRAVAHTVTDSAGTFVLVAPATAVYRVGFEIFGWERLVGPVDTLHDGELRERAYPLTFAVALHGDSLTPGGDLIAALRHRESDAWHSASVATPDAAIRYPKRMALMRLSGDVVAQYVVNEQGRVLGDTWRPSPSRTTTSSPRCARISPRCDTNPHASRGGRCASWCETASSSIGDRRCRW